MQNPRERDPQLFQNAINAHVAARAEASKALIYREFQDQTGTDIEPTVEAEMRLDDPLIPDYSGFMDLSRNILGSMGILNGVPSFYSKYARRVGRAASERLTNPPLVQYLTDPEAYLNSKFKTSPQATRKS
jgi:hypothetical protein